MLIFQWLTTMTAIIYVFIVWLEKLRLYLRVIYYIFRIF